MVMVMVVVIVLMRVWIVHPRTWMGILVIQRPFGIERSAPRILSLLSTP